MLEIEVAILRRAAVPHQRIITMLGSGIDIEWLTKGGRETVGYLLECWREPVVGFIARGEESIATTSLWSFDHPENSVVGRKTFESGAIFNQC